MKLHRCIVWILLVLAGLPEPANGQLPEYSVRKFGAEYGLRYGIRKVVQDSQGFVWLMCNLDLQRFDGKNTDHYFKGEKLHSLLIDSRGKVWATTENGIFRFDRQSNRFSEIAIEATDEPGKIIFEPAKGELFCIAASGLYIFNEISEKFVLSRAPSHRLRSKGQRSFLKFSYVNHVLYYEGKDTVWRHDIQTGKADTMDFPQIMSVLALSEAEIIVSTWEHKSWYYNFATGRKLRLTVSGEDPLLYILAATALDKDHYYLATSKGLAMYKPGTDSLPLIRLSFEGKSFSVQRYESLYKGVKGYVWAGTPSNLLRFDPFGKNINFIQSNAADPARKFSHDIRNFAEDKQGNLWLATGDGLTCWDVEHNRFSTIRAEENATDKLNHASIRGLVYDGTHLIIGQTNKGIWLYNTATKTFKRPVFEDNEKGHLLKKEIEQTFIHQIYTLKNGDHIIAAGDEGAYLMNGANYSMRKIDFPGPPPHVEFSYQNSNGAVFIGTENSGLYCFDDSLRYQHRLKAQLEYRLTSLLEHESGYYLGTRKGLYFFSKNTDTIAVKKVLPGLNDQPVSTLFEDSDKAVWIVTENKLYQYFPETEHLNTYGYSENIRGDFFHPNSYIRKSNGQVFIGSINGIFYFYPEKADLYPERLHPYIRDITVHQLTDSIHNFGIHRRLKRHQNTINISFATPYYGNPEDISYRYQLTEGGPWFNHGARTGLTLWGLPPGDYRFRVAAALPDEVWHTSQNSFSFTILPPFWETWWFTLAVALLGGGILYGIVISFQRKLKTERLLNVFGTSLYGHHTVSDILQHSAGNCVEQLGFSGCVIYEIDKKKNLLRQKAGGVKNPFPETTEIPVGKGIVGAVAASGKPKRISTTKKDVRYGTGGETEGSEIAVPLRIDGEVFGVMASKHPKPNFHKRYHLRLLEKIAGICAERIRKYLTEERLRGKIARDLHDEMGSTLTSIHIISKMMGQDLKENTPAKKQLTRINDHASGMMEKMSDMVWAINPANDRLDKLMQRVREYAVEVLEPSGIGFSFREPKEAEYIKLNPEQRKNIYLIAKEALNNTVKYSRASKVGIHFKENNNVLAIHILDNGKGYDKSVQYTGNGIKNMIIRAEEIGGVLVVETAPGKGVSLLLRLFVEKTPPK